VCAARVAEAAADIRHELSAHFAKLVEIHAAPRWLWPTLVEAMLAQHWTVEKTRAAVARVKDLQTHDPVWPSWNFRQDLIAGTIPARDVTRVEALVDRTAAEIQDIKKELATIGGFEPPGLSRRGRRAAERPVSTALVVAAAARIKPGAQHSYLPQRRPPGATNALPWHRATSG
jgi:hypothetical protein